MCEFCVPSSFCDFSRSLGSSSYFLKETKRIPLDRARESSSWGRSRSRSKTSPLISFPITRLPTTLQQHLTLDTKYLLSESLPHPFNKHWRPYSNKPRHHGCESCGRARASWVRKALKESRRTLCLVTHYFANAYDSIVDDSFDDDYDDYEMICE